MADIIDNKAASRFEMAVDGTKAFVTYRRMGSVIQLNHAEVPPALEGRGIGSQLVQATLDAVRAEGLEVVPRCSFVAAFIRRHPEYSDLVTR